MSDMSILSMLCYLRKPRVVLNGFGPFGKSPKPFGKSPELCLKTETNGAIHTRRSMELES